MIMKKLIYIFLILIGFTSCMREDKVKVAQNPTDKVEIRFDVTLPEPVVGTKAMKDQPDVQNLYVAVFGSSGFLKEYVQADVEESQLARVNGTKYSYSVKLTLHSKWPKCSAFQE